MLAARITLAHFSVSSTRNLPKSVRGNARIVTPASVSRVDDIGISETGINFAVKLLDDRERGVPRGHYPTPAGCLEAGNRISDAGNVRKFCRARRGRYTERAQLAGPDVREDR